jgi:hypothetical protein
MVTYGGSGEVQALPSLPLEGLKEHKHCPVYNLEGMKKHKHCPVYMWRD